MALIQSGLVEAQIKSPTVRGLLHQRSREFRYSDLTPDPKDCTHLPTDYYKYTGEFSSHDTSSRGHISWTEKRTPEGPSHSVSQALENLSIHDTPIAESDTGDSDWFAGQSVVCPTFAGGESSTGEDVFTNHNVFRAILSFFEEVSQDTQHYCNPLFKIFEDKLEHTLDNPPMLDQDGSPKDSAYLQTGMSPEQAELDAARMILQDMSSALNACPPDLPKLAKGREKLEERIKNQETKIQRMERDALGHGALRANEAATQRENWRPETEGPQVAFAGTMVDSELLRAAGLPETAEEGLRAQQS